MVITYDRDCPDEVDDVVGECRVFPQPGCITQQLWPVDPHSSLQDQLFQRVDGSDKRPPGLLDDGEETRGSVYHHPHRFQTGLMVLKATRSGH